MLLPVVALVCAVGLSACSSSTSSSPPTTAAKATPAASSDPYAQTDLHAPAGSLTGAGSTFDQPFFIVLNFAVGGDWPGPPDASTVFPQDYRIDYVRVYSLPSTPR